MRHLHGTNLVAVALAAVLAAGCADRLPRQKTYPVTGQVLIDGAPAAGVTLVFHPVDKSKFKWDERPQARTDDKGNFTLTTYETNDGAPAGEYKVGLAILPQGDDDGSDQVKRTGPIRKLPAKYGSHETSGITAKVASGATALEPFKLQSKP
jgi:hypothetical protein